MLALGCGGTASGPAALAPGAHAGIEVAESEGRPRLSLVQRAATPSAAAALSVAHDLGPAASAALGGLLEARLQGAGFPEARAEIHGLGIILVTPVSAGGAERFVTASHRALTAALPATGPDLDRAARHLDALKSHRDELESALAPCTGGLSLAPGAPVPDLRTPAGRAQLASWLARVAAPRASALAVVGPSELLAEARAAHAALPEVASSEPAPSDPWPARDVLVSGTNDTAAHLSVALRAPDPARVMASAESVNQGPLRERLAALGLSPEPALGVIRPRGGCLLVGVPLQGSEADPARVAVILDDELRRAWADAPSDRWYLDDPVVRSGDPREVAGRASWRSLTGQAEAAPLRRFIAHRPGAAQAAESLSAERLAAAERTARVEVPLASQHEPGLGGIELLLASPCSPADEDASTAGSAALWATTAALDGGEPGLTVRPWITSHGVGLWVEAHRSRPGESLSALAERAARAAGQRLTRPLPNADVTRGREQLLAELGAEPDAVWDLALEASVGPHPSWLVPRGTWSSVSLLGAPQVERRRRLSLRGPWRAALVSGSAEALPIVKRELGRWLWPHHDPEARCEAARPRAAQPGLYRVKPPADTTPASRARIVVALPPSSAERSEAELLVWLLSRPGGWLAGVLPKTQAATATATLLGGARAAALSIEIQAEEAGVEEAVTSVRALLTRLARGAVSPREYELATLALEAQGAERAYDPAHRAVALWLGRSVQPPKTQLDRLKQLMQSLEPSRHVVVLAEAP